MEQQIIITVDEQGGAKLEPTPLPVDTVVLVLEKLKFLLLAQTLRPQPQRPQIVRGGLLPPLNGG
ncbi:MAG: hypothetical protein V4597_11595 [Pseudomonadota bacterium]